MKHKTIGIVGGGLGMLHTVAEQLALRGVTIVSVDKAPPTLKYDPEPLLITADKGFSDFEINEWQKLSTPSKHQCLRKKPKRIKNKKTHRKKK